MAPVHAEAQDMVGADRRAQLDLAAEPGRGRVALIEDELVARRTDHLVGEVARLEIGERTELPAAAMDEADTRVVGGRSTVGAGEAQGALVAIDARGRLGVGGGSDRRDRTHRGQPKSTRMN